MMRKCLFVLALGALVFGCSSPVVSTDDSLGISVSKAPTTGAKPPAAQSTDAADPGSSVYAFAAFNTLKWNTAVEKRPVEALIPKGASGKLPIFVFMGGKTLQSTSFFRGMVEHVAKKGIVMVFVEADDGSMVFGAADQVKPARAINEGANEALAKIPVADATRVYYGGHSLGSKCTVIAAALATTLDTTGKLVDPKGILLFAFDNSNGGPMAPAPDNTNPANGYAVKVAPFVEATIVEFEDDSIAGPAKKYSESLYAKIPSGRKQHLVIRGAFFKTSPSLTADHNTALTSGNPMAGGKGKIDCLDWFQTWRFAAGIPLASSNSAYVPFVYGSRRIEGGLCSNGAALLHLVKAQNF